MKGIIYFTTITEEDQKKHLAHMYGEELLRIGLEKSYGKDLRFEPRSKGEFGKPFFTREPKIHYNISHSGKYFMRWGSMCRNTAMSTGRDSFPAWCL